LLSAFFLVRLSANARPTFLSVLLRTTDLFVLIFNKIQADYFLRLDRFCTLFTPVLISKNVQSVLGTFQQKIVLKTSSRAHVQTFGVARWRLGDFSTKKNILLFVLLWKSFLRYKKLVSILGILIFGKILSGWPCAFNKKSLGFVRLRLVTFRWRKRVVVLLPKAFRVSSLTLLILE